jgi:ribosomal protein S18 acetylase RimI-like enzyme
VPSPELTFRLATPDDAETLAALVQSAYRGEESRQGWTTEADLLDDQRIGADEIRAIIENPERAVLAALDEQAEIIGCCELRRVGDNLAYFGMFAIRPMLQAAGIGRTVLATAEAYAVKTWQARTMEMQVIGQRADLIAWYERRGYAVSGERRRFPYDTLGPGEAKRDDLYFEVLVKQLSVASTVDDS